MKFQLSSEPHSARVQTGVEHSSIDYPGCLFDVAIDGPKVTGKITLDLPNPRGRVQCRIAYAFPRTALYWTPDRNLAALRVAAHWFKAIGGFQMITHRILCHIVSCLHQGRTEKFMHWAVSAYAASEWHYKNPAARLDISTFFLQPRGYQKWLEEAPQHKAWQRSQAAARQRARDDAEYKAFQQRAAEAEPIRQLTDDQLLAECRLAAKDKLAKEQAAADHAQAVDRVCREAWDTLDEQARRRVQAIAHKGDAGRLPEKRQHFGDAEYRRAVHRAAHAMAGFLHPGKKVPPLPDPAEVPARASYRPDQLEREVIRRAWPDRLSRRFMGPRVHDQYEAVRDYRTAQWLGDDVWDLWCRAGCRPDLYATEPAP